MDWLPTPLPDLNRIQYLFLKESILIKRHLITHDIIRRPGDLVAQRLDRDDSVSGRLFPLVKPLRFRQISNRKIRRLHIGPGQILVAVFLVVLTLLLAV